MPLGALVTFIAMSGLKDEFGICKHDATNSYLQKINGGESLRQFVGMIYSDSALVDASSIAE